VGGCVREFRIKERNKLEIKKKERGREAKTLTISS
jgi:hypothetical protein